MNRKTLFTALACALLAFSMLGCGTSNHLQSIQLTVSGTPNGLFDVVGIGGTLQFVATGYYTSGKTHDLSNVVTYSVIPNPDGIPLPAPPLTVTMSPTGLMTAVNPAACTWHDSEPDPTKNKPQWSVTGGYIVTATFQGVTSQQAFTAVASATGDGPGGACGPDQVSQ
ncbi:MAG: hypothetical protein LAO30_19145 [Acidobacteriia bacterium]|nr:hypothetical protein [Terriglobia bacterium]